MVSPSDPLEFHAPGEAHIPPACAGDAICGDLGHRQLAVGEVGRLLAADVKRQLLRGPHGHIAPLVYNIKDPLLRLHPGLGGADVLADGNADDGRHPVIVHDALADIPLHIGLVGGKVRVHLVHIRLDVRCKLKIPGDLGGVLLNFLAGLFQIGPEVRHRHIFPPQLRLHLLHLPGHRLRRFHDQALQPHRRGGFLLPAARLLRRLLPGGLSHLQLLQRPVQGLGQLKKVGILLAYLLLQSARRRSRHSHYAHRPSLPFSYRAVRAYSVHCPLPVSRSRSLRHWRGRMAMACSRMPPLPTICPWRIQVSPWS